MGVIPLKMPQTWRSCTPLKGDQSGGSGVNVYERSLSLEQGVAADRCEPARGCASSPTADAERARERSRQRSRSEDAEGLPLDLEASARAEQERLDRADRERERLGDLLAAAALELAHHQGRALVEGEAGERVEHVVDARLVVLQGDRLRRVVERDLVRAVAGLAPAHAADVVRDRDQPVVRAVRAVA